MGAAIPQDASYRYRFADVVIEPEGRRVFVAARERAASRRAFDLLLTLCESPGRVLSRDELTTRLWPGGQIVSDEALTQAIFRARAVLGAQGERIVTVRGVGIRFDADVQREAAAVAASSPVVASSAADTSREGERLAATVPSPITAGDVPADPARAARRVRVIASVGTALVLALILLALAVHAWPRGAAWIDAGYGIRGGDVHAARADTVRLLADAMRHDNGGDRARARALLEALDDSDARTPWPPLLIGLWAVGAGDAADAQRWLARARDRAAPLHDAYVNAVLRYAEAERDGAPADIIRYAGAVLDLRPQAWRMHLARAHLKYYQGLREAALAEIRQIDVDALGNRKLEAALADRASFGDVAGAQAVLDRLPRTTDAAAWDYLAGRIAWSRGDRQAARAAWERAADEAQKNGRSDIGNRARANAGLAAMLDADPAGAIDHFERARIGMTEAGWVVDEVDLSLLLAQLQMVRGNAAAARKEFERALDVGQRNGDGTVASLCALIGLRLFPDITPNLSSTPPTVRSLATARSALRAGDRTTAREELAAARRQGVLDLPFADEARLLAAELGEPVEQEKALDPPYPPLAVAGARVALASIVAAREAAPGGATNGLERK
ncbi:winged helix-turn-helix domain-containing protein [Dokdonella sp.]|uniref:winged helix-turn-helix domain-containing protein n=1 Tax=Dokdonella sp. TaxID=2291710 RepID=UPI002F3EA91D